MLSQNTIKYGTQASNIESLAIQAGNIESLAIQAGNIDSLAIQASNRITQSKQELTLVKKKIVALILFLLQTKILFKYIFRI